MGNTFRKRRGLGRGLFTWKFGGKGVSEKAVLEGVVSHHGFHCIMKLTH